MAFIDNMRGKFTQVSQSTVQKAKDLSDVTKYNGIIAATENQINELYGKLGYEVYRAYADKPLPEVKDLINQIQELHQKIKDCKQQIATINYENCCPQCRMKINKNMTFCSYCGCRLIDEVVDEIKENKEKVLCDKCGSSNNADSLFCSECGNKLTV